MHPLVVIFAILAGGEIHGIGGMLIAIPPIPLVKDTSVFLWPRLRFQSWGSVTDVAEPGQRGVPDRPDWAQRPRQRFGTPHAGALPAVEVRTRSSRCGNIFLYDC
jgi:hypothetical protein